MVPAKYSDGDGIVNFADGYELPQAVLAAALAAGIEPDDTIDQGEEQKFTPVVIEIPSVYDPSLVKLRFNYAASDPAAATFADGEFQPGTGGNIRLCNSLVSVPLGVSC